jgi:hypothetical protein
MRRVSLIGLAVLVVVPPVAQASITTNTVDTEGVLSSEGRRAAIGVILECDDTQTARLRVTLTQPGEGDTRGVIAERRRAVRCTTERTSFPVRLTARSRRSFAPGEATG